MLILKTLGGKEIAPPHSRPVFFFLPPLYAAVQPHSYIVISDLRCREQPRATRLHNLRTSPPKEVVIPSSLLTPHMYPAVPAAQRPADASAAGPSESPDVQRLIENNEELRRKLGEFETEVRVASARSTLCPPLSPPPLSPFLFNTPIPPLVHSGREAAA
jgi:hypothetical protein